MDLMIPENILKKIEKPSRYIGNELNVVKKELKDIDIRVAFCFPDVYEIGMSHLGLEILYHFFNERNDVYCERVFSPWIDLEEKMRENDIPLFSLETQSAIKDNFDLFVFTLQYEMSYTNILNALDLSDIPFYSKERTEEDPIICAGGPCAYNPEPLADFVDFFYMGEGEVVYNEIFDIYKENKKQNRTKHEFLEKLLDVEGIYVPKFYDVDYNEDGTISSFKPNNPKAKAVIKKVVVKDLDKSYYPTKPIVPYTQVVHDRVAVELFRGCIRGCRFCQAGMVYRPVRKRSAEVVKNYAKELLENTGYDEISLLSLSSSDYPELDSVCEYLIENTDKTNISLPSLRVDEFSLDLMNNLQKGKKSSLTFAPEAGSQRMRDVINKGLTEEQILHGAKLAFEGGWSKVKLYFMLGLPTETEEDVQAIQELAYKVVEEYFQIPKEERVRNIRITVSTSFFVPKAFTPFQWAPQDSYEKFMEKQTYLNKAIRKRQIQYNCHDAATSMIEGVLARGDRRIGQVLVKAWERGAKFDGWSEFFKLETWLDAFKDCNIDPNFYNTRKRELSEILPWDHISVGVSKEFLIKEYKKALEEEITPNCIEKCTACGANSFGEGVCYEKND